MVDTVETKERLPKAVAVIFASLVERMLLKPKKMRLVELADIQDWLMPDPEPAREEDEDAEEPMYNVRRVLSSTRMSGKTYYLVDSEPTLEPRENCLARSSRSSTVSATPWSSAPSLKRKLSKTTP